MESSPTPVEYEIQTNDTLGDIALRFDITVAALQAANPGLDPRALQPGQRLVIPSEFGVSNPPTRTVIPPELSLPPPTCYETPLDSLLCLGEVPNTLDNPLEQVVVTVNLLDAAGAALASATAEIEQAIIPPGGSAPYRALFDVDPNAVAGAVAALQRADDAEGVDERFTPLEARDAEVSIVDGRYAVAATLYNPGLATAQAVRVIVTLKDDAGQVIGYRVARVADSIAPDESLPVRLEIVAQTSVPEPEYTVYVEARRGEGEP